MKRALTLAVICAFALSGCISTYTGPKPDFSLKGPAAKAEYEKFHFDDSYWMQSPLAFTMGPEHKARPYYTSSLEPVIKEVSPEAWDKYKGTRIYREIGLIAVGAAAVVLVSAYSSGDPMSRDQSIAFWSLIGTSYAMTFIQPIFLSNAAERYNEDLKRKFTPALGMNFQF